MRDHRSEAEGTLWGAFRRNVAALSACEICWGVGVNLASETAILPVLLHTLGASGMVLGLIPALSMAAAVGQPFAGFLTERMPRTRLFLYWAYTGAVVFWLLMGVLVGLGPGQGVSRTTLLAGFLVLFGLLRLGCMFANAPYTAFIGRVLDPERRSFGYGLIFALNTLAGMGGALSAAALLRTSWPWNFPFACCLALTWLCTTVGNLFILLVWEPPKHPQNPPRLSSYLVGSWREAWHVPGYRALLAGRACLTVHPLLVYFYVVEAGVSAATGSSLMALQTAGTCLGVLVGGRIGDRLGHRPVVLVAAAALASAMLLMLTRPSLAGLGAVAGLCGLFLGLLQLGQFGLVLELCPRTDATIYYGLMQSLLAPLAIAAPLLGGYLRDKTSYPTVLKIVLGLVILGGIIWKRGLPSRRRSLLQHQEEGGRSKSARPRAEIRRSRCSPAKWPGGW